jgi:hypothetical protein
LEAIEARALAFAAEWRRVFGPHSGVDWASDEHAEIDAWIGRRNSLVRCHMAKAVAVLASRTAGEGESEQGTVRVLHLLHEAGAILTIGGRR